MEQLNNGSVMFFHYLNIKSIELPSWSRTVSAVRHIFSIWMFSCYIRFIVSFSERTTTHLYSVVIEREPRPVVTVLIVSVSERTTHLIFWRTPSSRHTLGKTRESFYGVVWEVSFILSLASSPCVSVKTKGWQNSWTVWEFLLAGRLINGTYRT